MASDHEIEVALDNDVLLKAACYGVALRFWPQAGAQPGVGVLGAARFVLRDAIERAGRVRDRAAAGRALEELLALAAVLEPSDEEVEAAAELERLAQRAGLPLDSGESQLAAMVTGRDIAWLHTGDKRAVAAFDRLADDSTTCAALCGRVRCLEQLFLSVLSRTSVDFETIVSAVCAEPDLDKTTTICFACHSGGAQTPGAVCAGLESYVRALRNDAPRVLAA